MKTCLTNFLTPIIVLIIISAAVVSLAYVGGTPFFIGLGAIAISMLLLGAVAVGAWWSRQMMRDGAQLAIMSADNNDRHDATKIKALAALTREAIKARNQMTMDTKGLNDNGFPALLPVGADVMDANFTIAGLDEETAEGTATDVL